MKKVKKKLTITIVEYSMINDANGQIEDNMHHFIGKLSRKTVKKNLNILHDNEEIIIKNIDYQINLYEMDIKDFIEQSTKTIIDEGVNNNE